LEKHNKKKFHMFPIMKARTIIASKYF
jgi:hypothetical protein